MSSFGSLSTIFIVFMLTVMTRRKSSRGVGGVVHRFGGPEVGVAGDAAVLVFADGLAFHDPFEGGFAVDDVGVVGCGLNFMGIQVV